MTGNPGSPPPVPGARLLVDRQAVEAALDRLAGAIQPVVRREPCVLLGVLLGGMVPLAQLSGRLQGNFVLDACRVRRYGDAFRGGTPEWLLPPQADMRDRHVFVVDDIHDEGVTLQFVRARCLALGASRVTTTVLVRKRHDRPQTGPPPDLAGLEVGDEYVFGRGMDYRGQWRHLPDIWGLPVP
ncbi:MAG: hypoxanthine-guanine phosphoribosyltransferase [Gammaproteobacteria bacterium]|nr:hypoxanthine-guanine phosphoribosyltransferase [Gammaproteobacteria bacterium]